MPHSKKRPAENIAQKLISNLEMAQRARNRKRKLNLDANAIGMFKRRTALRKETFSQIMAGLKDTATVNVPRGRNPELFLQRLTMTANHIERQIILGKMPAENRVKFPDEIVTTIQQIGQRQPDGKINIERRTWVFVKKPGQKVDETSAATYTETKVYPTGHPPINRAIKPSGRIGKIPGTQKAEKHQIRD